MPTTARKTSWYSTGGPWGGGLLCVGLATTAQGIAYILNKPEELTSALAWINGAVPIAIWGCIWLAAGSYSITKALTPPQRHGDLIPAVGVISLWAAFYATHWIYLGLFCGHWTRDWATAVAWGSLASVLICFGRCNNPATGEARE